MSRDLSTEFTAQIDGRKTALALFVEGEFESDTLRLWSGYTEISWDGKTWQPAGQLLAMSPVRESQEVKANGVVFTLTGLDSSLVSLAYNQNWQGRPIRVWLCPVVLEDASTPQAAEIIYDRSGSAILDRAGATIYTRAA